ncbi:hypothetical protein PSEUDO8BK_40851 [Pseudomonas sp. 8BK]|nr:hypothetical protein PSEUDO8BK_40851 [Pseudomonas sp. 8BK]
MVKRFSAKHVNFVGLLVKMK